MNTLQREDGLEEAQLRIQKSLLHIQVDQKH